jgi:hypothetical protein
LSGVWRLAKNVGNDGNSYGKYTKPIGSGFGSRSTAAEVLAGIDLAEKLFVVTGGYSGLGLKATRALASAGARVIGGDASLGGDRARVAGPWRPLL